LNPGAGGDPFAGAGAVDLETSIAARARTCGIELTAAAVSALASHAREVLRHNVELKLTSITAPADFVERHIGESLEGASLLAPDVGGRLLDLGSGNGYPGIAIALARPGLMPVLAEATSKKAAFLRGVLETVALEGEVLETRVDRPHDLGDLSELSVLVTRAAGGWEKIVPRLARNFDNKGRLLIWAGREMELIMTRAAWRRFQLLERHPLPGRDASWVWMFAPVL
jgi:16S rRNA (guanine527-N7)-methyltransferase